MRKRLLAVLLLAACDAGAPDANRPPAPAEPVTATATPPKPAPPQPRYVGRWAERPNECTTRWWRFWADELRANVDDTRCDILPPDASMGDERRRTACISAGRAAEREEWVMTYPADGLMTLSRNGAAPITLGRCA